MYIVSMENVTRCDECGREIRNGEGHRIGCNFDRTPRLNRNAMDAERRTRIAKYVAVANRINPRDGSKREQRFEFEFSKTGISQRGETVEDFARRHVSDCTGGYAELVRVEKVEVA